MAEFANVLCVCFGRRSFELVRTIFYLRGMSAIVRTGPRRSPSRPRSSAKIRLSRGQKQILFAFCRGGVSKTQSKIVIKPRAKANLFAFCRGGVFKVQPNIRIGPGARANLAEVWAIGDNALYRTDNRLPTPCLLLCPVVGSACYESCETEFPGLCSGCPIPIPVRSGNIRCRKFK